MEAMYISQLLPSEKVQLSVSDVNLIMPYGHRMLELARKQFLSFLGS